MSSTPAWRLDDRVQEGAKIGFYEVEQRLGSGGLAVVYRARDVKLDRRVALKFLGDTHAADPGIRERFLHEARAMARLHHTAIVGVHALDEIDERPYFAMELVEGGTLADRLGPDLILHEVLEISLQVVDALEHAWSSLQLVHRDIKPANILLARDGRAKLADFGLAKVLAAGVKSAMTQTGTVMGTPFYLSPEQIRGQDLDHRSDFYSLGATLYHCVTGAAPFDGDAAMAIVVKHLEEVPVPARQRRPGLDASVDQLVTRLLSKKRDDRPADHATLRAELAACLGESSSSSSMSRSAPRVTAKRIPLADTFVQTPVPPPTLDVVPSLPDDPAPLAPAASLRPWRWVALVATMVLVAGMVTFGVQSWRDRHGPRASWSVAPSSTPAPGRDPRSGNGLPPAVPAVPRGKPATAPALSLLPEAPTVEELRSERDTSLRTGGSVTLAEWQMKLLAPTEPQRQALQELLKRSEGPLLLARARIRFQLWILDQYLAKLSELDPGSSSRTRLEEQIQQLVGTLDARLENPWTVPVDTDQRRRIDERLARLRERDLTNASGMRQTLRELGTALGSAGEGRDILLSDSELARLIPLPG